MKAPKKVLQKMRKILLNKEKKKKHRSPFRRYLSHAEAELLAKYVSMAFETSVNSIQVQDVAGVLRNTEDQMTGRVAGDVSDHVLSYYMISCSSKLSPATTLAHGEIGTLFGGSLLMMLHALRRLHCDHWALSIDPLDGYYGQDLDPVTGLPVTLENVLDNIRQLGFGMDKVRIVNARSESREALQVSRAFQLASLWIDGDHSYEGIKRDWQNYSPLVTPQGYILIDNYHDGCFPGVDKFVDEDLLPNLTGWKIVANINRSILFKKQPEG